MSQKIAELGGKAVTLSGPDGYIYDPDGITTEEKFNYMLEMRASSAAHASLPLFWDISRPETATPPALTALDGATIMFFWGPARADPLVCFFQFFCRNL